MRIAGKRHAEILRKLAAMVRPGISTIELDAAAESMIRDYGDRPAFKGYRPDGASAPYPATLITSVKGLSGAVSAIWVSKVGRAGIGHPHPRTADALNHEVAGVGRHVVGVSGHEAERIDVGEAAGACRGIDAMSRLPWMPGA